MLSLLASAFFPNGWVACTRAAGAAIVPPALGSSCPIFHCPHSLFVTSLFSSLPIWCTRSLHLQLPATLTPRTTQRLLDASPTTPQPRPVSSRPRASNPLTRLPTVTTKVSNATSIYLRRPGVARKFRATLVCEGKVRGAGHPGTLPQGCSGPKGGGGTWCARGRNW